MNPATHLGSRGYSIVSTLYSIESTVDLIEYPPGDSSEYTMVSVESHH